MRPRNALLAACPWLSRGEASAALRDAGGDLDAAKRAASASRRRGQEQGGDQDGEQQPPLHAAKDVAGEGRAAREKEGGESGDDGAKSRPTNDDESRAPPRHSASVNNLSDRQYCCVWSVEVYEDGYRPDVARTLLAAVARHVNPILRDRGWRVKRLIESASTQWIGLCTANGRNDADAASTNIQLNLRVRPDRRCTEFRSFHQILAVMLHEITHTSIGLEDIHPPAFWELLDRIKVEYRENLAAGKVDLETDDYGCNGKFINSSGDLASVADSASDVLGRNGANDLRLLSGAGSEGDCGASKRRGRWRGGGWKNKGGGSAGYTSNVPKKEKKRPLLKGAKMVDKRTKAGKAAMADRENLSARDLAARAALARFGDAPTGAASSISVAEKADAPSNEQSYVSTSATTSTNEEIEILSSDDEEDNDSDEPIIEHKSGCGCRCCDWSKLFQLD